MTDISLLQAILQWLVAGMVGVLVWLAKSAAVRLKRLEECAVRRTEFVRLADIVNEECVKIHRIDGIEQRAETSRKELRDQIFELHRKIDDLQKMMIQCIQTRTPHQ